jgi:hypothetical protein
VIGSNLPLLGRPKGGKFFVLVNELVEAVGGDDFSSVLNVKAVWERLLLLLDGDSLLPGLTTEFVGELLRILTDPLDEFGDDIRESIAGDVVSTDNCLSDLADVAEGEFPSIGE